jgi:uncharacterized protein YuzE
MYMEASIALVCTYDSDANAAYIHLEHPIPPAAVKRVLPFDPSQGMFNLDLDAAGHILGLEILAARTHLPPALLQAILEHNQDQTENSSPERLP